MKKANKTNGNIKNVKKSKMILLFLLVSFLFWMLIKLSKEYTDTVTINVAYFNLPQGKVLQTEPKKTIEVTLKTFGFDLIKYHLFKREINVDLQEIMRKNDHVYYQLSDNLLSQISTQLISDVEVYSVKPDTLFYNIGLSTTKKVKVIPQIEIQYESGYNLFGDIEVNPKEITISGPEKILDSINQIDTEKMTLENVKSSFEIKIPLIALLKSSKVEYSEKEVTVTGTIEKFTEARFTVPFKVQNLPNNYVINTFPDQVEIIFQIGISDYNKINKNDFIISCDYERSKKDELNYLIPVVELKPSFVSEVRIKPNQIEYLIKE